MTAHTIAFDIDGTWSLDPKSWLAVFNYLEGRGFRCIIVTGSTQPDDKLRRLLVPKDAVIIVSGSLLKESAAMLAGYKVDVWIDDMPGMIQDCRIIGGDLGRCRMSDYEEPVVETLMLRPRVGMTSLVGVSDKNYPIKFGNYCSIVGLYLCNMWAENLQEWARLNSESGPIEVTEYRHAGRSVGMVTDERLRDWCNQKPCVAGLGWPSVAVMRLVCAAMGADTANRACGCEKEDESSCISEIWHTSSSMRTYRCTRCGRKWEHLDTRKEVPDV